MIKNNTAEIIKKHGLKLTKALGQNFLTDFSVVTRIVDASGAGQGDPCYGNRPGSW